MINLIKQIQYTIFCSRTSFLGVYWLRVLQVHFLYKSVPTNTVNIGRTAEHTYD